jgi:hypothetical protein
MFINACPRLVHHGPDVFALDSDGAHLFYRRLGEVTSNNRGAAARVVDPWNSFILPAQAQHIMSDNQWFPTIADGAHDGLEVG